MAIRFPGIRTIEDAIARGLFHAADFFLNTLTTVEARLDHLRFRYPSMTGSTIHFTLRALISAAEQAKSFFESGIHPGRVDLRRDPTLGPDEAFAYEVKVEFIGQEPDERTGTREGRRSFTVSITSPYALTPAQLGDEAERLGRELFGEGRNEYLRLQNFVLDRIELTPLNIRKN